MNLTPTTKFSNLNIRSPAAITPVAFTSNQTKRVTNDNYFNGSPAKKKKHNLLSEIMDMDNSINEIPVATVFNPNLINNSSNLSLNSISIPQNNQPVLKKCKSCGMSTHLNKKNNLCPENNKNKNVRCFF